MPTFSEAYSALVAVAPQSPPPSPEDPFRASASILLGRTIKAATVRAILEDWDERGLASLTSFVEADDEEVEETLRSAGVKLYAKLRLVLKRLAGWIRSRDERDDDWRSSVRSAEPIREELIAIQGIGAATADAIALHALGLPTFPVDRAAYRLLVRHGWLDESADYEEARSLLMTSDDPADLVRLEAAIGRIGREFCRPGRPKCLACPLRPFLPEGGAIEPSGFED